MYEMVTLRSPAEVTSFLQALEYKPTRFLAARVKTLCLTNSVTKEQAAQILSVCSGVVNLACWVVRKPHETLNLSMFIAPLSLKRLSIDAQTYMDLQDLSQNNTAITNTTSPQSHNWRFDLTHLDIIDWWPTLEISNLPGLDLFHHLTHFSLYFGYTYNSGTPLSSILKICNYLSVLLVTVDEKDDATAAKGYLKEAGFDDPRLAVLPFPNAITDWEAPLKGGDDIWLQAEAVVQKQCHDSFGEFSNHVDVLMIIR